MSCQMIKARDWDQMVQSGRVGAVAPTTPSRQPAPELGTLVGARWPDLLSLQSDGELLVLLDRVLGAQRQLQTLVTDLATELAHRETSGPLGRGGPELTC
jgi:hypothetical protein